MLRKSCLNPSKVSWEPSPLYSVNIYRGCQHGCLYCWAKVKAKISDSSWKDAEKIENILELIEAKKKKIKPGAVILSLTCDCYQKGEDRDFVRACLKSLLDSPHHILILTKSHLVMQDYDIISQHENVEVGFTFTSLKKTKWEPNAPSPHERIVALEEAAQYGPHGIPKYDAPYHIKTFCSIEPWIPWVTEPIQIISKLGYLVDRWIIGKLNHLKVPDSYYREVLPGLVKWLDSSGVNYYLKPELAKLLPANYPSRYPG